MLPTCYPLDPFSIGLQGTKHKKCCFFPQCIHKSNNAEQRQRERGLWGRWEVNFARRRRLLLCILLLLCLLCLSKQLEDCLVRLPWLVCHWLRLLNLIMSQISKSFFPLLLSHAPFSSVASAVVAFKPLKLKFDICWVCLPVSKTAHKCCLSNMFTFFIEFRQFV